MADMRVVVAGAGGRMGRTLISAIASGQSKSTLCTAAIEGRKMSLWVMNCRADHRAARQLDS
jgi:dihydrodipicolinate reductase